MSVKEKDPQTMMLPPLCVTMVTGIFRAIICWTDNYRYLANSEVIGALAYLEKFVVMVPWLFWSNEIPLAKSLIS